MTDRDDDALRERFASLRREDAAAVRPFRALLTAKRAARRLGFVVRWAGAAIIVIVVVGVLLATRGRGAIAIDLATVRWEGPTDFLLRLPGEDLLRTVPRFN